MNEDDKFKGADKRAYYIDNFFDYLYPDEMPNHDSWYIAFPQRYNNDKIKFSKTYSDYLKNKDLQERIDALGLDTEKFWYFILFLYDICNTKAIGFFETKEGSDTQFFKLLETINSCIDLDENNEPVKDKGEIVFNKDISFDIRINGKKQKFEFDNKAAFYLLSVAMKSMFPKFENRDVLQDYINNHDVSSLDEIDVSQEYKDDYRLINTRVKSTKKLFDDKFDVSDNYRNYLLIDYMRKFFESQKESLNRGKSSDNLYDKEYFIGYILCFMNWLHEKQDKKDYIKNTMKYYKNFDVGGFSFMSLTYR